MAIRTYPDIVRLNSLYLSVAGASCQSPRYHACSSRPRMSSWSTCPQQWFHVVRLQVLVSTSGSNSSAHRLRWYFAVAVRARGSSGEVHGVHDIVSKPTWPRERSDNLRGTGTAVTILVNVCQTYTTHSLDIPDVAPEPILWLSRLGKGSTDAEAETRPATKARSLAHAGSALVEQMEAPRGSDSVHSYRSGVVQITTATESERTRARVEARRAGVAPSATVSDMMRVMPCTYNPYIFAPRTIFFRIHSLEL